MILELAEEVQVLEEVQEEAVQIVVLGARQDQLDLQETTEPLENQELQETL